MAERRRGTVLLVDDEATIRVLAERMLELAGFRVVCCSSGEAALGRLADGGPSIDVLVSDVQLDGVSGQRRMNGPTLAAEVRRRHPGVGIVLMSGNTESEAVDRGMAPGTRFLSKPYKREELVAAVEAALASRADG